MEGAAAFFLHGEQGDRDVGDFREFLVHLGKLPGVLRANVYGLDGTVRWSSDASLIGKRFLGNDELEAALGGEIVMSTGMVSESPDKAEHRALTRPGTRYVENYLPVTSAVDGPPRIIGAVEVYRQPMQLLAAIERTQQRIWWGALAVTLLLYLDVWSRSEV